MPDRAVRVYRLDIEYPPGSFTPGWVPACWDEYLAGIKDKAKRRAMRRRGFRWPREHLYLSSSGAYSRAWLLRYFGATVFVDGSDPVAWPEWEDTTANRPDWYVGSTAARWTPDLPEQEDPLDASARYLYPAPAEPYQLTAADVRETTADIFEGDKGIFR